MWGEGEVTGLGDEGGEAVVRMQHMREEYVKIVILKKRRGESTESILL